MSRSPRGRRRLRHELTATVTAWETATVVVDPPTVRVEWLPVGRPPGGVVATCPVGGAAIEPLRIPVDPDNALSRWAEERRTALSVGPSPGEPAQFHVFATTSGGRYAWHPSC
ncbi:LIM domain-containing protein [Streptomyces kanasensis]|uniref:hypothetical protein n=1 Tax=Streptomyces kanasensis TaxID=936756 RepID=UPI003828B303